MSLTLNVGPNNLLPSSVGDVPCAPTTATWFEGALTVRFDCDNPVAVLLDFASDEYFMFTTVNGYINGYVEPDPNGDPKDHYVTLDYVEAFFSNVNPEYVDHDYVSPDYVVE